MRRTRLVPIVSFLFVLTLLGLAFARDVDLLGLARRLPALEEQPASLSELPLDSPIAHNTGSDASLRDPNPNPGEQGAHQAGGIPVGPSITPLADPDIGRDARRAYLADLEFHPQDAQHFGLVDEQFQFSEEELVMLARNGFVIGDRYQWQRFVEAYAWIYWKDLPVLITTDSILHSVHQSYSDLLQGLEHAVLVPQLLELLTTAKAEVSAAAEANQDPAMEDLYSQVEAYLGVPLALLDGTDGQSPLEKEWLALASEAGSVTKLELFGATYEVDFTLFQPRGHYVTSEMLARYFGAMSWLAQIDFRFVEFDPLTSEPRVNPQAMAAVAILRDAFDAAQQREAWTAVNDLVEVLVGQSDNMTMTDFDRFWRDMNLSSPSSVLAIDQGRLLAQLTTNDYGQQRITGQLISRHVDNSSPTSIPRPVSFMLLGQRFSIDSFVLGGLVYDRLMLDDMPVERALPSPLDVMYALGNDRAATHLTDELEAYSYAGHLGTLRQQIDGLEPAFWDAPLYNQWLSMIRAFNAPGVSAHTPQAMRTEAWADKVLHTQLASWAQLRHDNILYVKQSFTTAQAVCEYPAGYVEPVAPFYAALNDYAQAGHSALANLDADNLTEMAVQVRQRAMDYFGNISFIAQQLGELAEKELRLQEFTAEEEAFVKSFVKRQSGAIMEGCVGPSFEELWDGWYMSMFFDKDDDPAVVADIHTNPTNDPRSVLFPPRVLHVATGPVAPLFMIVDTDEGSTIYVGPAFTYFEVTEEGYPPVRMTDEVWRQRLTEDHSLQGPAWTASFRLPSASVRQPLILDTSQVLEGE